MAERKPQKRVCRVCGTEFTAAGPALYCSDACKDASAIKKREQADRESFMMRLARQDAEMAVEFWHSLDDIVGYNADKYRSELTQAWLSGGGPARIRQQMALDDTPSQTPS